ncbi:MAG: hypothetical protein AAF456_10215 [Planctomycetota bacterium]
MAGRWTLASGILALAISLLVFTPVCAQQYLFTSQSSGTVWQATVTDTRVDMTSNGITGTYFRLNQYDVPGYRMYSNESRNPPVIGIPVSGTGLMLTGTNSFDRSTYRDSDLLVSRAPTTARRQVNNGIPGSGTNTAGGASVVPLVGTNPSTPSYSQFSLSGGGFTGTAAQSVTELRISIGSNAAEIYQRASVYDVPGFQAYQNPTLARVVRWPSTGVGTMSIGDIGPGGSISWNSSPLQITPVTPSVTAPVIPGGGSRPVVPPGGGIRPVVGPPVVVSSGVVPFPPLPPAELVLWNNHDKEILIRLTDFRNEVDSPEFRIAPGQRRTVYLERDAGSELVQVLEDGFGTRTERRVARPGSRIYDISVYVMKQQSVAYGLNGEIEDATYVPQSVGKIEVPAGAGLQSGTSDIYNEALRRSNAGGVDRLRDPQWNR